MISGRFHCDFGQESGGTGALSGLVIELLIWTGIGDFGGSNHKQFTNILAFFGHVCGNPCNKL